jgi:signal recognition particle receptor subunit beta
VGSLKEDTTVVVVSYSGKEINAKVVYYGAGLSGKTTNLEAIYEAVPESSRGKMVSMKTQSDRTLFFDLLPLDLGEIMGFRTRFLLYTVPGQVFYNATRKLVLKGADAIVFVADSEVGKMEENKDSLANLRANLAEYKLNLDDIPWVIQYNKRDLPNVYSLDELNAELNPAKVPCFEAVATQGKGVFETFRGISHLLMERVTKDLRRNPGATTTSAPSSAASPPPVQRPAPEPVAPPRNVSPPAPMAPARAIEREAQQTRPVTSEPGMLEYGRQLDLPDRIPEARPVPSAPTANRTPAAVAERAVAAAPAVKTVAVAVPAAANSSEIVVPISFPAAGQTGEILIRIVLRPAE